MVMIDFELIFCMVPGRNQYHIILITQLNNISSDQVVLSLPVLFCFETILTILGGLNSHENFRICLSVSKKTMSTTILFCLQYSIVNLARIEIFMFSVYFKHGLYFRFYSYFIIYFIVFGFQQLGLRYVCWLSHSMFYIPITNNIFKIQFLIVVSVYESLMCFYVNFLLCSLA